MTLIRKIIQYFCNHKTIIFTNSSTIQHMESRGFLYRRTIYYDVKCEFCNKEIKLRPHDDHFRRVYEDCFIDGIYYKRGKRTNWRL